MKNLIFIETKTKKKKVHTFVFVFLFLISGLIIFFFLIKCRAMSGNDHTEDHCESETSDEKHIKDDESKEKVPGYRASLTPELIYAFQTLICVPLEKYCSSSSSLSSSSLSSSASPSSSSSVNSSSSLSSLSSVNSSASSESMSMSIPASSALNESQYVNYVFFDDLENEHNEFTRNRKLHGQLSSFARHHRHRYQQTKSRSTPSVSISPSHSSTLSSLPSSSSLSSSPSSSSLPLSLSSSSSLLLKSSKDLTEKIHYAQRVLNSRQFLEYMNWVENFKRTYPYKQRPI